MTVADLIEALREMPQDMSVRYVDEEPVEITTVKIFTEPRSWGGAQWVRIDRSFPVKRASYPKHPSATRSRSVA